MTPHKDQRYEVIIPRTTILDMQYGGRQFIPLIYIYIYVKKKEYMIGIDIITKVIFDYLF